MTVDDFSAQYAGKSLQVGDNYYKFYDSTLVPQIKGLVEDDGSREYSVTQIDINEIRQSVLSGSSLVQAVASKVGGTVDGDSVKFNESSGEPRLVTETLRHYDIDFSNLEVNIPSGLYGKGFRAYCATDSKEWFNFVFTNGSNAYESEMDNIKPININVSGVTNITELVQTIYDQANALLTGDDSKFNHHMRIAADLSNNTITLYDHRRFDVSQSPYDYQERGAKIADGTSFKVSRVKDLVIQHTDKAGMNIHVQIPDMTLKNIFDPLPDAAKTIFDYPVTDKKSRDALLGSPNPPGILDNGLKYLLDAVTLVGAQNRRLEFTLENITTEIENLTASESTISDADMAKEMAEYTKYNILSQSSQAMLAQANQNQSMVMSLLQ